MSVPVEINIDDRCVGSVHGEWGLWGGVLHSRGGGYVIATDLLDTTKGK